MIFSIATKCNWSHIKNISVVIGAVLLISCNSGPKMIEAESDDTPTAMNTPAAEAVAQVHKAVVNEVLQTSKYTYLNVTEDGNEVWIAVPKTEAEVGETYYYRGGLKKTNFKSVEHNRVFETVYLVSGISKSPSGTGVPSGHMHTGMEDIPQADPGVKIDPPSGGISIAELFKNRSKYDGQTVRIKGRCVKLNNMIMNRNWVHLQDGSLEDSEQNLTITTTENIPLGAVVAVEGVISLNKDFGAGYRYDIIMEEAHLLQ
jgi:starvation-inducible outer membrane lipoprotein